MADSQPPQRPPGKPPAGPAPQRPTGTVPAQRPTGTMPAVPPGATPVPRPTGTVPAVPPGATPVPRPTGTMAAVPPGATPVPRQTGTMAAVGAPSAKLAASAAGQAAVAFISALSKAARSFTLYDPSNAVVRGFLSDYKAKADAATSHGPLVLELQPFQMIREGELVYQEEDRERSLSFRLFRDGLRQLTFERGVSWEDLLGFLQILAVRYTGVRQQEDDSVTLLRKAEFTTIAFRAVEGFVPEEDNPEPFERVRRSTGDAAPPPTFDTPFPALPQPAPAESFPVPDAAIAALHAEERPEAFGKTALGAVAVLLREAARGDMTVADARQFVVEARDFFLADGSLGDLSGLADLVAAQPAGPLRDEVLRSLGDPRVLELLVGQLGSGGALPAEALRLVPLVSAASVLDLLATEQPPERRAALLKLVEARLPADAAAVVERLNGLDAQTAKGLARSVASRSPDRVVAVLLTLLAHPDEGLRVSALEGLQSAKGEVPVAKILPMLGAPSEAVRIAAAHVLERRGAREAFQRLQEALVGRKEISHDESDALARALATLHPARATALFTEWVAPPKGLLKKAFGGRKDDPLRWAGVSGLGAIAGPQAEAAIEEVAKGAGDELKHHCMAVLARRRHQEKARHG